MAIFSVNWQNCSFIVDSFAGRLRQLKLTQPDGKVIEPLAEAFWNEKDPENSNASMILDGLGGNWLCVPFGMAESPKTLDANWATKEPARPCSHGETSNHQWEVKVEENQVRLFFTFPEDHDLESAERIISQVAGGIEFTTKIKARRNSKISLGHHPIMAMPETVGSLEINFPAGIDKVFTYPIQFEEGVSTFAHGKIYDSLNAIETTDGKVVNASKLPCVANGEELVIVKPKTGCVEITNKPGKFISTLTWELEKLPACLLWMSMTGRTAAPWDGKFYGLGVEPICGAFDLGLGVSRRHNPLNDHGMATVIEFTPEKDFEDKLTITCRSL